MSLYQAQSKKIKDSGIKTADSFLINTKKFRQFKNCEKFPYSSIPLLPSTKEVHPTDRYNYQFA